MPNRYSPTQEIGTLPYTTDRGIGFTSNIGLISLAYDQTIEHEFNGLVQSSGVATYCTRIKSIPEVTPETLRKMEDEIVACVEMLPPGVDFQTIAFGCTSAAFMIGEENVSKKIQSVLPGVHVTDPMTAALAAFKHLNVKKIGLLTPYIPELNEAIQKRFLDSGIQTVSMGTFCEANDNIVAKIDINSVKSAMLQIGAHKDCDAVFMSCTSLRALEILTATERKLGKPVTTSNHALAWHALKLGGATSATGIGQLFNT